MKAIYHLAFRLSNRRTYCYFQEKSPPGAYRYCTDSYQFDSVFSIRTGQLARQTRSHRGALHPCRHDGHPGAGDGC